MFFGHGTDNALDESAALVFHALGLSHETGAAVYAKRVGAQAQQRVRDLIARRINERVPAVYLTGETWFAGLSFQVDPRVLIPRSPIAELIERQFAPWIDPRRVRRVLDVGTGSGCIAIACAKAFPRARVDAVDISDDALEVARINVRRHRVGRRLRLVKSDHFSALAGKSRAFSPRAERAKAAPFASESQGPQAAFDERRSAAGRFQQSKKRDSYDIIVANPPYVGARELQDLPPEYRHEPRIALAAGRTGLDSVRVILRQAGQYLRPQGLLVVEVGNTETAVRRAFSEFPFVWLDFERGGGGVFLLTAEQLQAHAPTH